MVILFPLSETNGHRSIRAGISELVSIEPTSRGGFSTRSGVSSVGIGVLPVDVAVPLSVAVSRTEVSESNTVAVGEAAAIDGEVPVVEGAVDDEVGVTVLPTTAVTVVSRPGTVGEAASVAGGGVVTGVNVSTPKAGRDPLAGGKTREGDVAKEGCTVVTVTAGRNALTGNTSRSNEGPFNFPESPLQPAVHRRRAITVVNAQAGHFLVIA